MSDLISRKALLEEAEYDENYRLIVPIEKIKRAPIAYDVDKVVSELEKENKRLKTLKNNCIALCDHEVIGTENKAYDYAIKIVKSIAQDLIEEGRWCDYLNQPVEE